MNHNIESMKPSAYHGAHGQGQGDAEEDPTVIGLAGGEPDFATPDRVSMAAIRSLTEGNTHHVVGPGIPELRHAIAEKLRRENGVDCDESCVLVTPGGKNAIYLAVCAALNTGDEAIILDPAWVSYEPIVQAAGGVPVKVKLDYRDDYRISRSVARGRLHRQDPPAHPQLSEQPHRPHPARRRGRGDRAVHARPPRRPGYLRRDI